MDLRDFVIDPHDDGGALFRSTFPKEASLPPFLKTAARLDDLADEVRNENFALVMIQDDSSGNPVALRKFAVADLGNAVMSAHYFHFTHQFLPPTAKKVAAANIASALKDFEHAVPEELIKAADGVEPDGQLVDVRPEIGMHEKALYKTAQADPITRVADGIQEFARGDHKQFHPEDRRSDAQYLSKQAQALGIDTGDALNGYAGDEYGDLVAVGVHARYQFLDSPDFEAPYEMLLSKHAELDPDTFAKTLAGLDQATGLDRLWDGKVSDPWQTALYKSAGMYVKGAKRTAETENDDNLVVKGGPDDFTSGDDIKNLAVNRFDLVKDTFGEDFAKRFKKNPIATFKSLPATYKELVSRTSRGERDGQ